MGRFSHKSAIVIAFALLASGATLLTSAGRAQVVIKSNVKLVRLLVSVKDAQGQLIGSLEKKDFTVYDTGVKQEVAVFEHHTALPLSISLLVDVSLSTGKDLKYEITSMEKFLNAFLREGNPDDAASLYSFSADTTRLVRFTRRETQLVNQLRLLRPTSGTSLYDALYLVSHELTDRDGRHVIVVVTDGGNTTSNKTYLQALEAAHRAEVSIYPIVVVPITNDAGRNVGGENALTTLAAGTGGRVFSPTLGAQLDKAFEDVLRDLRTQYLVAYYPKNLPPDAPRFHPVRVELSRPELRASTRTGYYEDSTAR